MVHGTIALSSASTMQLTSRRLAPHITIAMVVANEIPHLYSVMLVHRACVRVCACACARLIAVATFYQAFRRVQQLSAAADMSIFTYGSC